MVPILNRLSHHCNGSGHAIFRRIHSNIFSWMNPSDSNIRLTFCFGTVFGIFAFIAILIACFGLLGLSAYNVLQRTKEIGIRKVMGATVNSILILLSRDFLKLILLALMFCYSVRLVYYEQMATGLCLPDKYRLVGICYCRTIGIDHCGYYHMHSNHESSHHKSRG